MVRISQSCVLLMPTSDDESSSNEVRSSEIRAGGLYLIIEDCSLTLCQCLCRVYDMIEKYHTTAKKNGAIMIPQNGIESAPTDLMCWMLVNFLREKLNVETAEVIHTIHEMKASASGGTLATALSLFDAYSLADFSKSQQPWSLCPVEAPKQDAAKPILEKVTGVRTVDGLGTLTDSIQGPADIPIVHRSWGLYDDGKFYGKKFRLSAYSTASNALYGFAFHVTLASVFTAFILPPVRWMLKQFVYQPGDGPTKEYVLLHVITSPLPCMLIEFQTSQE